MAGPRYMADPEEALRVVVLDGLTALFHAPSGMTHIVAPPVPEILAALREGPATIAELIARLKARYDFEEECGAEAVEARLAELEQAGLVRRLYPPCAEGVGRGTARSAVEGLPDVMPLHQPSAGPPPHEAAPHREESGGA